MRIKANKAYKLSGKSDDPNSAKEMSREEMSRCVRFWKDVYRQPKSSDEMRFDIGFFLRFKNTADSQRVLVYLKFELVVKLKDRFLNALIILIVVVAYL